MTRSHLGVRMLCEGAIMVALAQILSYLKLMELPNGGSLTPAMFPIILFAVRWGLGPGLMAGFVFGLLQLIFDGVSRQKVGHFCGHDCGLCRALLGPLYQRRDHL